MAWQGKKNEEEEEEEGEEGPPWPSGEETGIDESITDLYQEKCTCAALERQRGHLCQHVEGEMKVEKFINSVLHPAVIVVLYCMYGIDQRHNYCLDHCLLQTEKML